MYVCMCACVYMCVCVGERGVWVDSEGGVKALTKQVMYKKDKVPQGMMVYRCGRGRGRGGAG